MTATVLNLKVTAIVRKFGLRFRIGCGNWLQVSQWWDFGENLNLNFGLIFDDEGHRISGEFGLRFHVWMWYVKFEFLSGGTLVREPRSPSHFTFCASSSMEVTALAGNLGCGSKFGLECDM